MHLYPEAKMTKLLFIAFIFYYIASPIADVMVFVSNYKSELYLYTVAQNVGFLKWFYGL